MNIVGEFHLADRSDDQIFQAPFGLKNAQHAVAREYGFDEWTDLKRHVEFNIAR